MNNRLDPRDLFEQSLEPGSGSGFESIRNWARSENKTLVVFDLEATQKSPHFAGFGIIELGLLCFRPSGSLHMASSLIDPERRIPQVVIELTGITANEVVGKPKWGNQWCDIFHWISERHVTAGFNSWSYDCRAVEKQNQRYGQSGTRFQTDRHIDVYCLPGVGGKKLEDAAREFAIPMEGRSHRALADATTTAHLLDRCILQLSPESLFGKGRVPIVGGNRITPKAFRWTEIEEKFKNGERPSVPELATQYGLTPSTIENDLTGLLQASRLAPDAISDVPLQRNLDSVIHQAIRGAWQPNFANGLSELKSWIDENTQLPTGYFQLRISLIRHGYEYRSDQNGWVIADRGSR